MTRELALLLISLGRASESREMLERVWAVDKSSVQIIYTLARVEARLGVPGGEEKRLRELLAHHPGFAPGQQRLIALLVRKSRWREALPLLEDWVAAHPRDAGARYNIIAGYLNRLNTASARPHYEALKQLAPARAGRFSRYFRAAPPPPRPATGAARPPAN